MFTLRDIIPEAHASCADVKCLIKEQLSQDITEDDFDIGYLQGNTVVSIRSKADLDEIWEGLRRGLNTILWCDGMQNANESQNPSLGHKRLLTDQEETEKSKDKKKKRKKMMVNQRRKKLKKQYKHSKVNMAISLPYAVSYMGRNACRRLPTKFRQSTSKFNVFKSWWNFYEEKNNC